MEPPALRWDARPIGRRPAYECGEHSGSAAACNLARLLMRQSAQTVKKLSLELGGNAPLLVFTTATSRSPSRGRSRPVTGVVRAIGTTTGGGFPESHCTLFDEPVTFSIKVG